MSKRERHCRECGKGFTPARSHGEFCCSPCRLAFHNRRRERGGDLYDIFMTMRYERGLAKALGVWTLMCRLAQEWREDDADKREGRTSWGNPADVIERRPYLKGARFQVRAGR